MGPYAVFQNGKSACRAPLPDRHSKTVLLFAQANSVGGNQASGEITRAAKVDISKVMELTGGRIAAHRIYWGWFGTELLINYASATPAHGLTKSGPPRQPNQARTPPSQPRIVSRASGSR
jgi:hypothetical protein